MGKIIAWLIGINAGIEDFLKGVPWFPVTISFAFFWFIFEGYLDLRQIYHLKFSKLPKEFQGLISSAVFEHLKAYNCKRIAFLRIEATIGFICEILVIWRGVLVWMWDLSLPLMEWVGLDESFEVTRGVLYMLIVSTFSSLYKIPTEVFRIFRVDAGTIDRHFGRWLMEQAGVFGMNIIFGVPLLSLALILLRWDAEYQWFYTILLVSLVSVFFSDVYPNFVAPLFDTFESLEGTRLRERVIELCEDLDFELDDVYMMDGSKRSMHSNAFLMGMGKQKKIILYDTLLRELNEDEVLAIIGHEIGHYEYNHIWKQLMLQLFCIGNFMFLFSRLFNLPEYNAAFGFNSSNVAVGLINFSYGYQAFANILQFVTNSILRKFEYTADGFAMENGLMRLEHALIKMQVSNVSNLNPDRFFSGYHFAHPSLYERIKRLKQFEAGLKNKKEE